MASPAASLVDGKKACSSCGALKRLDEFSPHPTGLGGRRSHCRACMNERSKSWRKANPERVLEDKRKYWVRHAERINAQRRENRDDAVRARERAWWRANPARTRAQNHRRRAATSTTDPAIVARIRELLEMPCVYCGSTEQIEIDHVVPLARGGLHVPDNLAAACQRCNRSKKDRLVAEWRRS